MSKAESATVLIGWLQFGAIIGAAVIAAIVAAWGVFSQRAIARRTLTLNHMSQIDSDRDYINARKLFIKEAGRRGGLSRWAAPGKEYSKECQAIRLVLNEFELISIGIQFGVIDYEFYRRYYKGTVIKYWYAAAPFVYSVRHQIGSKAVYHEFEEMYRWFEDDRLPKRKIGFRTIF